MTTILTAVVGLVLAAGTAVGVAHAVSDNSQRSPASTSDSSQVVLYGTDK